MAQTLTPTETAAPVTPGIWLSDAQREARLELVEALPVRLAESDLAKIRTLAKEGKSAKTIAWRVGLDSLIVELELRRVSEREAMPHPFTAVQQEEADDEAAMQRLDRRDMNRLARGTHIPNVQLRQVIDGMVAAQEDLTVTAVLTCAGYTSTSHGRRQLGYMRASGTTRYTQTIRPGDAARIARALGVEPREVVGL